MEQSVPLVVLGAGQRCGSTLIQRLLCSHPSVRIWGEHAGQLRPVLAAAQRLSHWTSSSGLAGRRELDTHGHQGFIANLTPERAIIDQALVAFVDTLFGASARAIDRPIWGFKEVHYRLADILLLRRLFPDLRVIQLVRDPRDVLCSLDEWERSGGWDRTRSEQSLRLWTEVAASFVPAGEDPDLRDFILPVRYEDLVSYPQGWTERIARHCGLDAGGLDLSVFDVRVHTVGGRGRTDRTLRTWAQLPPALRALLDDEVAMVATAYGYDP